METINFILGGTIMKNMLIKTFGNWLITISMIFIMFILSVSLGRMDYEIFKMIAMVIVKIFEIIFGLFGAAGKTLLFVDFVINNLGAWIIMFLIGCIIIKK